MKIDLDSMPMQIVRNPDGTINYTEVTDRYKRVYRQTWTWENGLFVGITGWVVVSQPVGYPFAG